MTKIIDAAPGFQVIGVAGFVVPGTRVDVMVIVDQGAGGMAISVGKLALYTHGHPHRWGMVSEGARKKFSYVSFGAFGPLSFGSVFAPTWSALACACAVSALPIIDCPNAAF